MTNEESPPSMEGSERLLDVLENQIVPLLDALMDQQKEILEKINSLVGTE